MTGDFNVVSNLDFGHLFANVVVIIVVVVVVVVFVVVVVVVSLVYLCPGGG